MPGRLCWWRVLLALFACNSTTIGCARFIPVWRPSALLGMSPKATVIKRAMWQHFLAALAYRTQKARRGAPAGFAAFRPGNQTRTPKDLLRHMSSVLGYARTFFIGGSYQAEPLKSIEDEIVRFHSLLEHLTEHLHNATPLAGITEEQLLQGPLSDAMTHAGQLALLRRLAGVPVAPENFYSRTFMRIISGRTRRRRLRRTGLARTPLMQASRPRRQMSTFRPPELRLRSAV
jgi:hypothetical protein